MNKEYGKVQHDKLVYAPDTFTVGGKTILNPTDAVYKQNGWYKIQVVNPKLRQNQVAEFDKFAFNHVRKTLFVVNKAVDVPRAPRKISKIYLKIALARLGKLSQFMDWLKSVDIDLGAGEPINAYDAFESCLVVDEGDRIFAPYIEQAKLAFGLTDEQYDRLIDQCIAK